MSEEIQWIGEGNFWFRRLQTGDVQVVLTDGTGKPLNENGTLVNVVDDHVICIDHWISDILNLTAFSERPNDWHKMRAHHQGEVDTLSDTKEIAAFGQGCQTPNVVEEADYVREFYAWRAKKARAEHVEGAD